eukprot:Gb_38238 [translate_table: standard]
MNSANLKGGSKSLLVLGKDVRPCALREGKVPRRESLLVLGRRCSLTCQRRQNDPGRSTMESKSCSLVAFCSPDKRKKVAPSNLSQSLCVKGVGQRLGWSAIMGDCQPIRVQHIEGSLPLSGISTRRRGKTRSGCKESLESLSKRFIKREKIYLELGWGGGNLW